MAVTKASSVRAGGLCAELGSLSHSLTDVGCDTVLLFRCPQLAKKTFYLRFNLTICKTNIFSSEIIVMTFVPQLPKDESY